MSVYDRPKSPGTNCRTPAALLAASSFDWSALRSFPLSAQTTAWKPRSCWARLRSVTSPVTRCTPALRRSLVVGGLGGVVQRGGPHQSGRV